MTILVIGGTGQVGTPVVQRLAADGLPIRVMTRDPAKATLPHGVEAVRGDGLDVDALRAGLDGASTLFLLSAVVPDELTRALLALELAARAGVGIVYVSMANADVLPDVPHAAAKRAAERLIVDHGLPATILRLNYFMQNDALREPLLDHGVHGMPIGRVGAAMIDIRDIADIAALEVVRRERAESALPFELIDVSGPETLTADAICAIWSEVLDRPVRYGGDDLASFEHRIAAHIPSGMALHVALMFRAWQRIGVLPQPGAADALARRLGRPLRTYRAFAQECAEVWLHASTSVTAG